MTEKHNGKCKYFMSPIQSAVKKKKKLYLRRNRQIEGRIVIWKDILRMYVYHIILSFSLKRTKYTINCVAPNR